MAYHISKRLFDIGISLVSIVILLPVILMIFIALTISYNGKQLLFLQERIGERRKPFILYKFRSLKIKGQNFIGHDRNDETKPGHFLRKYSLDELPQLFNVLRGDLSIVGPRPLPVAYIREIDRTLPQRNEIKPGLFGLAQNKGRNGISWEEKFDLDHQYILERSFWFDLNLFINGVIGLFRKHNGHIINAPLSTKQC